MSKRLRLAIVTGVVFGALAAGFYSSWQRRPSVVHQYDWGGKFRGDGVLNVVLGIDAFDSERRRFSYYTGGRSGDSGALTSAPTRVLAEAKDGTVSVRVIGFDVLQRGAARDEALEIARIVSAATTRVFPAAAIPVEIDLHVMPEGARFSLAKRVDWREDQPYVLAIFTREQVFNRSTPVHELHHVLAIGWSLWSTPEATRRPGAASSYEEAAAELYAACGQLLANETLPREEPSNDRVTITDPERGDQLFEGALAGDELAAALDLMRSGANGKGFIGFGPLLAATAFEQVFAGATAITLESPQGARLLALCKDAAADPFAIEAWLATLGPTVGDASPPQARAD